MPDCRIGAVIMKMISNTRTTSMNGIILISESVDWVDFEICICFFDGELRRSQNLRESFFDLRGDLQRKSVQALAQRADIANKIIIKNYRGDGGKKSRRRGDQGLRNARCDRAQAGGAGGSEAGESVNNAPN